MMKNVWKKLVGFTLAACTLASACVVSATSEEEMAVIDKKGSIEIQPMANYVQLDTKISAAGAYWTQPWGYSAYRIWVDNTTNRTMTVTITSIFEPTHSFTVGAQSNKSYVVNDASYGKHKVIFSTSNNVLSGTVRVRVSEAPL